MKDFKDLNFTTDDEAFEIMGKVKRGAYLAFENGYGISVISGWGAYGSSSAPYECAVIYNELICYNTDITDDVIGHCDEIK